MNNNIENNESRGIALYIKRKYFEATPDAFLIKFCEDVWAAMKLQSGEKLIAECIYHSPNSIKENNQKLCQLLQEFSDMQCSQIMIMGDINFPNKNWETQYA